MITALALCVFINGFGWALGVLPALHYAFKHRTLPPFAGFRALSGPFEALGMDALIVAGLLFVTISAFRILAAYWLWRERFDGAVLELILLGLSAIFWYGFALPFGPPGAALEIMLMVLSWGHLR